MERGFQAFDLIEEITLSNDEKYFEISNIFLNGIAEYALNKNMIKAVKIVKLNIFHSKDVEIYEKYINENCVIPDYDLTEWIKWDHGSEEINTVYNRILKSNGINN